MLGIAPIQKPDAYIHFAPKEPMELKYCVSISAPASQSRVLKNTQLHAAVCIVVPVTARPRGELLDVGRERVLTGGGFVATPFPEVFIPHPFLATYLPQMMPYLSSKSGNVYERNAMAGIVSPFDNLQVQLEPNKPTRIVSPRTSLTWTYEEATSINGISVYSVSAQGHVPNSQQSFVAKFWFRIKDSSLERFEMKDDQLAGRKLVMSRIR
ncbi:MAG: hypothetical protein WCK51_07725 [Armatimonadota bacterium]